jgi:hypothetical protein
VTRLPLEPSHGGGRYPGFDSAAQSPHWDETTAKTVLARLDKPGEPRFFTPDEYATVAALADRLLYQHGEPRVPIEAMIDERLADRATDGYHHADMPYDIDAWRITIQALNDDAVAEAGVPYADLSDDTQIELLQRIHHLGNDDWHDLRAGHVWNMWMRYCCVAFYSHPLAWDEIGFAGPAYPRGYKNLGIDKLEPFEVPDVEPRFDPVGLAEDPT